MIFIKYVTPPILDIGYGAEQLTAKYNKICVVIALHSSVSFMLFLHCRSFILTLTVRVGERMG